MLAWAAGSALAGSKAVMTVEEEARALIGAEYIADSVSVKILPHLSCTSEGGGRLVIDGISHDEWWEGRADCQGRSVLLLERWLGRRGEDSIWRVVDAVVLPPYDISPGFKGLNALWLLSNEECEINGRPRTSFLALARFGKRKRVDGRTGVQAGWTFDIEAGRIVPLPTSDIVCQWFEP